MFNSNWKMKLDINHKDDLTFQGYKVSLTDSAVHHGQSTGTCRCLDPPLE